MKIENKLSNEHNEILEVITNKDFMPALSDYSDVIAYLLTRDYFASKQDGKESGVNAKEYKICVIIKCEELNNVS